MKIKIETHSEGGTLLTDTSYAAIQAALDAVNGGAKAFTIHDANDIADVVETADDRMISAGIKASEYAGTVVTYRPAGPAANAYKNSAISTKIKLKAIGQDWYLVGVERATVYPRNPPRFTLKVTDKTAVAAARRVLRDITDTAFEIVPPAPAQQIAA